MQRLEEGSLDVVIVVDFEISPTLHTTVLQQAPALCVLPEGHPLADAPVALEQLADEPYIMLDIPRTRDYFLSIFGGLGLQPNIAHRASSAEMVRSLVANGFGYSLLNFTMQRLPGTVYVPLATETRPSNLVAVRQHRRRPSKLLDQLVLEAQNSIASYNITNAAA
jgi:DNA-binding transcriptional LysR family regulator